MSSRREQIMWFKVCTCATVMTEDEIVESVVCSHAHGLPATSSLRWSIHRPKRGWYLQVRSPSFPPGTFIPPIPPAPKPAPASVTVGTIPTIRAPDSTEHSPSPGEVHINIKTHSYPPTLPPLSLPSPHEIKAKTHAITPQNPTTVTHFVFYPSLPLPTSTTLSPAPFACFSRALAYVTPSLPIRSTASFTLAPSSPQVGNMAVPLLTTDHTPTFSVLTTGLLEINKGIERQLGVAPGFWVAVALAYLEFLTERDSYLAAANG
ncbi:hypothetical protein JB92DRAFT_2843499 [Gautieria morchelliformis]|nr:hypothetical protein JB92DRAFT_2843499 [Gautieria morchelliformis]